MTCIVGIISKNDIHIGVDSASGDIASDFSQVIDTKKLIFKKGMMIGYTTSWRMGNVLEHEFTPPRIPQTGDLEKYMVVDFVGALRKCFKAAGFLEIENNKEQAGAFLVALDQGNRLFQISTDLSVLAPTSYASVGSGMVSALASLETTEDLNLPPAERAELALKAAAHFNGAVRPPFKISSFRNKSQSTASKSS